MGLEGIKNYVKTADWDKTLQWADVHSKDAFTCQHGKLFYHFNPLESVGNVFLLTTEFLFESGDGLVEMHQLFYVAFVIMGIVGAAIGIVGALFKTGGELFNPMRAARYQMVDSHMNIVRLRDVWVRAKQDKDKDGIVNLFDFKSLCIEYMKSKIPNATHAESSAAFMMRPPAQYTESFKACQEFVSSCFKEINAINLIPWGEDASQQEGAFCALFQADEQIFKQVQERVALIHAARANVAQEPKLLKNLNLAIREHNRKCAELAPQEQPVEVKST